MQFLNPFFLFGLLAIAIPIVIHLFNFRRFKKVIFSNVSFLKNIEITTKKQNKVRNLLLLASRILAIICIVFLFAQPFIPSGEEKLVGKGQNAVLVFIDNSFSMQNVSKEGRVLDEAKRKAREIANQYKSDDVFSLLTIDMEGRHQQFVNKERFLELLEEVEISSQTDFDSKLFQRSFDLLATKQGFNKRCFFVSDFQSSSFDTKNFPNDSIINTLLVPIEANNINNVYVDSISFNDPTFQIGQKVAIKVRVVNKADAKAEKVSVKLFLDNKQISVSSIDIEPNESQEITMNFTLQKHGIQYGYVSIIDNPITFDDNFYFTLQTKQAIEVLSINSEAPNPYISKLFSDNNEIKLTNINEKSIDFSTLNKYSLIILNGLIDFSSGLASELSRYRENSGDILIIPNQKMNLSLFQSSMQSLGLPYYSTLVSQPTKVSVINQENNLFRGVFSTKVDNMEMPSVRKYLRLSQLGQVSRENIMKLQNNDDFLALSQRGGSKVYIFTTNLTEDNTDLINQALFVPTLWNMALYSQIIPEAYYFLTDNKPIDISYVENSSKINVPEIISLDNKLRFIPGLRKDNQRTSLIIHSQVKNAGNYKIVNDGQIIAGLSLNYNRVESNLSFLSSNEIKSELKKDGLKNYNVIDTKQQMVASYFKKSDNALPFFIILLILVILSLLFETFLLIKTKK